MPKLTITELRTKAFEKAHRGLRSSAAGITYAQAAERALESSNPTESEQLARWWVMEKLDAGMFVSDEWCGEEEDLPLEVERETATKTVERAREIWSNVIFVAFSEGLRAHEDDD